MSIWKEGVALAYKRKTVEGAGGWVGGVIRNWILEMAHSRSLLDV